MTKRNFKVRYCLVGMMALLFFNAQTVYAQANWSKRGSEPDSYLLGIDSSVQYDNQYVMTFRSIAAEIKGYGNIRQNMSPAPYIGKRIRMTAYMKTKDVANWTNFFLRIDEGDKRLLMDNMQNRPIKGTTDWKKYTIILDVPATASDIVFGSALIGTGQIWFTNPVFEIVDNTVPTTEQFKAD